jgi:hypothetical protein
LKFRGRINTNTENAKHGVRGNETGHLVDEFLRRREEEGGRFCAMMRAREDVARCDDVTLVDFEENCYGGSDW